MALPPLSAVDQGNAMRHSDLRERLLARLRATGHRAAALGIDLGTTKSCMAYADFDPDTGTLRCECVRFPQPDGGLRAAVPSAVAIDAGRTYFGAEALAKRGQRGFLPERNLFCESKNEIGLRYIDGKRTVGAILTKMRAHAPVFEREYLVFLNGLRRRGVLVLEPAPDASGFGSVASAGDA